MADRHDTQARDRAAEADRDWFLDRHPRAAEGVVRRFVSRCLAICPAEDRAGQDETIKVARLRASAEVWISED